MNGQDAFWSGPEVRLQADQCHGQSDVWDMLATVTDECDACGAAPGEVCDPFCVGVAAEQDGAL